MAATQVNPTRMELTRLKKKLVTATRGHKLLKDKRDELMRQFLDMARENMALREKVEAGIKAANTNFVIAKAGMSEQILHTALMAPKQEVQLTCKDRNVMSVDIPVFEYTTKSGLKVYMWVNEKVTTTLMNLSVKYGSIHNKFKI